MFTNQMPIIQSRVKLLSLLLLLLLLIFGGSSNALASSSSPPDPATFDVVELPPEALTLADDFVTGVRTAGNPKLDAVLTDLTTQGAVTAADAADLTQPQLLRFSGSRVQVHIDIQAAGVDPVVQAVHAAGGEVTGIGRSNTLIQGWLPVEALSTVAAHPDVHLIRRPARAIRFQGHSVTEGAAVMEVSPWHEAGWRGQGIKVGIIDGDFQGYRNLSGVELPATVTTRNFVDDETDAQVDGKDVHGTAIAEIVHDIAPDAELYLAKIETLIDQEEAVAWLKDEQNVDIISTSIGWFGRFPGDGTGDLADLVRDVRAAGILWVTSAGNHGLSHWGGPYSDPDGDDIHNFAGKQEINHFGPGDGRAYGIPRGILIAVCARWSDWVKVDQDYDLHLVRWNNTMSRWELFASGRNPQTGAPGQTPTECAARVTAGSTTVYGFFIERIKGTKPVNFDIFELGSLLPFDTAVHARSLLSLADAPDAVTVAAVDVNPPHHQEPYSSEGPTNGPGGTEIGGFIKPNLAAYTNVSTASGNGQLFGGTSAATPHVAGAAALVQSRFPDFAPDQVQTFLEERAIDMGPPGVDTIFGYGRLHLGGCTVSISPTSHSFESDGGASSINVVTDDTCNWTVSSDVDWVTITAGDNGLGNGTIDYAVVANTDNISRTGWLVVAGQSFTVTQAAKPFNRLAVWPGSISITLPINSQITQTLTVSNIGEGTLNWGISETSSTCDVPNDLTWLRFTPTSGSISNGPPAGLTDGFTVTADTHIVQGRPASNFGQALQMPVGYAGAACTFNFVDAAARSLMQFDLSAIPADTPIGEAILNVHVDAACFVNNGRLTIAAYRIDDSWAESTATWNSQPGFAEAYGSFVVLTAPTWYQLEITELVRGWVNGTWPNLGLMLRADSESPGSSYVLTRVAARERAAGDLASYIDLIYGREQNSDNTTVTFDSTGMTPGTYSGKLCVQSTDSDMSLVELPITAGEEVDYVLTITNTGPDSAENVTVTDDLPASVTLVSATPTQGMCDKADREVTCSLGTLANGSSTAITITVMTTITATTVDDTELTNRANVHSNTADSNSENNIDTETTTVKPRLADLSLNVTDKVDPVTQGDTIEYTVTVTNSGPYSSENVILTNTLPSRVTFVSAIPVQGTCSESNGIVTCNLDTLANGISTTIIITVTTAITGPTDVDAELTNIASIRSSTADSNSENNIGTEMTTVKPRLADLSLTVTDKVDPVTQGDTIEYTVTVTNSGPYSSENVVLTNTLPSSVTFISALPLSANCTQVDEVVTCNLDAMNDDSSENITIVVSTTDQTPGTIINTVTIASNTADPDHINNLVTEDTHVNPAPVTPAADLLVKSNNATYLRRTGSMNYTVAVTNIGPDTATNVSLTIILPTGLIPISTSQTFGHCADTDKIVTCNLGNITQGNSVSTVISVSTTGIVSGTVTSTIDVSSDTVDPNRDNNIGHPSTSIQPHMILLPLIMGRQ